MKIRDIRACQPHSPGAPLDWRTSLGQILVAIATDDGLVGYGVGGGGAAALHVIGAVFRDMLVGRDVEPVEQHFDRLYRASQAYGRKGLVIMALSGIDLALWDLRGKAAGKPIHELLGMLGVEQVESRILLDCSPQSSVIGPGQYHHDGDAWINGHSKGTWL
jgi:L-rhamnonate dehydratase